MTYNEILSAAQSLSEPQELINKVKSKCCGIKV